LKSGDEGSKLQKAMTVEQIIRETRQWPPSQIEELVKALSAGPNQAEARTPEVNGDAVSRLRELAKKIDAVWAGTNIDMSTEDMIAGLRESRSRRE
jgi:hypothetical protein